LASRAPSETVKFVIKKTGIEEMLMLDKEGGGERLENVQELVTLTKKYDMLGSEEGIAKLLSESALAKGNMGNLRQAHTFRLKSRVHTTPNTLILITGV